MILKTILKRERGSALVEAAIIIPILVILLYWAIGMTDILVLRTKASEAARFALWENTVFRTPNEISQDVTARFRDLKSPLGIDLPYTGLMLYPQSQHMRWAANVNPNQRVSIGGQVKLGGGTGLIDKFLQLVLGAVSKSVDGATRYFQFNTNGEASVSVSLVRASHIGSAIFGGGEILPGASFEHSGAMQNFAFTSPVRGANPMRLVFDTWKAWPKPKQYQRIRGAPTDTKIDPMKTYTAVEDQVSAQVGQIAFYGLKQAGFITKIDDFMTKVRSSGVAKLLFGGTIPSIIGTDRMDGPGRGPITIRPVEAPDVGFCPVYRPTNGDQPGSYRLGELASYSARVYTPYPRTAMIDQEDPGRWTVPYKMNSQYFSQSGGNDQDVANIARKAVPAKLSQNNEYVKTYKCRGHYFLGSQRAGEADPKKRYGAGTCYNSN